MSRLRSDQLEGFVKPLRQLRRMVDDGEVQVEHGVAGDIVSALRRLEAAVGRLRDLEGAEVRRERQDLERALVRVAFGGPSPDEPDRGFVLMARRLGGSVKAVCEGDGCDWVGPVRQDARSARPDWVRHALDCEGSAGLVAEAEELLKAERLAVG